MKKINYSIMRESNIGTEDNPKIEQCFEDFFSISTDNDLPRVLQIVGSIAYNGEYTIEDDGEPEPEPTEQEQLRADVDFLLAMGGVL